MEINDKIIEELQSDARVIIDRCARGGIIDPKFALSLACTVFEYFPKDNYSLIGEDLYDELEKNLMRRLDRCETCEFWHIDSCGYGECVRHTAPLFGMIDGMGPDNMIGFIEDGKFYTYYLNRCHGGFWSGKNDCND